MEEAFADLEKQSALMPILPDSCGTLARAYGLPHAGAEGRAGYYNALFIVDKAGRVRYNSLLESHTANSPAHILRKERGVLELIARTVGNIGNSLRS